MKEYTGDEAGNSYVATDPTGEDVRGLGGPDTLTGGPGTDTINGNSGEDLLIADATGNAAGGNDSLYGGQGADTVVGARFGFGGDTLLGNRGIDVVIASTNGGDTLFGGQDSDTMYGSVAGSNTMNGDLGSDVLYAGAGGDIIDGGDGDDTMTGGKGNDQFFGGAGSDTYSFAAPVDAGLTPITGVEAALRTKGGFGGADIINDFGAGDKISIGGLNSGASVSLKDVNGSAVLTITGDANSFTQTVTVVGKTKAEVLASGQLIINANAVTTANTVNAGDTSTFTVGGTGGGTGGGGVSGSNQTGSPVADALVGTVNDETLDGLAGDDNISGLAGRDTLLGGAGADTLIGGSGADLLTGGAGLDSFVFNSLVAGEVDTLTDYTNPGVTLASGDRLSISAAAFGGSLIAGQAGSVAPALGANFGFQQSLGSLAGLNATTPIGISTVGYDSNGGGLYFDVDGGGAATFQLFAQLSPAPTLGNRPVAGTIEILA